MLLSQLRCYCRNPCCCTLLSMLFQVAKVPGRGCWRCLESHLLVSLPTYLPGELLAHQAFHGAASTELRLQVAQLILLEAMVVRSSEAPPFATANVLFLHLEPRAAADGESFKHRRRSKHLFILPRHLTCYLVHSCVPLTFWW